MGALSDELRAFLDANPVGVLDDAPTDDRVNRSCTSPATSTAGDLDPRRPAQGTRHQTNRVGLAVRHGARAALPVGDVLGPGEILTEDIGCRPPGSCIASPGAPEPPEPMSDDALADVGRVILAITVDRVSSVSYIGPGTE